MYLANNFHKTAALHKMQYCIRAYLPFKFVFDIVFKTHFMSDLCLYYYYTEVKLLRYNS